MRILRLALIAIAALAMGCGGSGGGLLPNDYIDLSAFERELSALPLPTGVDPALWSSLKDELRGAVTKAASERAASLAPESEASTVNDFAVHAWPDGTADYSWSYRNQGDYNQDKLVGVSDLTPVGLYFKAREGDANWDQAQLADGNHDGMITVSDITPIGVYYERRVEGYKVFRSGQPGQLGDWQEVAAVEFEDGAVPADGNRPAFGYSDPAPVDDAFYRVQPYDGEHLGVPSNYGQYSPVNVLVSVQVPDVLAGGEEATWHAEWQNGTAPYTISWDFGGGAENVGPTESESPDEQTVMMINDSRTEGAQYSYTVTVEDSSGFVGTAQGDYTVAANPHPLVTVTVPNDMAGSKEARWEASWIGGVEPFTIQWEFGGGAVDPALSGALSPYHVDVVMLNDSETEDAEYSYTVTVSDSLGIEGVVTGEYTVGPLEPIAVTVEVPEDMQGGESGQWSASWSHGVAPFEVQWELGGGANDAVHNTGNMDDDYGIKMLNDSRTDSVQYTYTVTVTDSQDLTGVASGQYTVGPNPSPLLTVTVPEGMAGGQNAEWRVEWTYGVAPFSVRWSFGGGADDIDWEEATSPDTRTVTMFNPSMTDDTEYDYEITVLDADNNTGTAEDTYTVGPGPNLAPEIRSAWFEYTTHKLFVDARDLNTDETLTVTVTEPDGLHADETQKVYDTNQVVAEFEWTADDPPGGKYGTTHVTLEDALGLSDETDAFIGFLEPDTLYAIPLQETAAVDEPVTIVVTSGVLPNPFQFLCMVGLTVEPGATMTNFDPGSVGDSSGADGIWGLMGVAPLPSPSYSGDNGDGRERWEFSQFPMGGHDLTDAGGDLFNFQFSFSAPGTYTLGFVESTDGIKRTYYGDWDEYEYFWGDISNNHAGFAHSIVVTE